MAADRVELGPEDRHLPEAGGVRRRGEVPLPRHAEHLRQAGHAVADPQHEEYEGRDGGGGHRREQHGKLADHLPADDLVRGPDPEVPLERGVPESFPGSPVEKPGEQGASQKDHRGKDERGPDLEPRVEEDRPAPVLVRKGAHR